jgi:hypothetical protein
MMSALRRPRSVGLLLVKWRGGGPGRVGFVVTAEPCKENAPGARGEQASRAGSERTQQPAARFLPLIHRRGPW